MIQRLNIEFCTIFLVLISLVSTQSTISINATIEDTTVSPTPIFPEETFDYVVKLVFGLENEKVPEYLVKFIYDNPDDVTCADIIALYSLGNVNLSETTSILKELGYDPRSLIGVNGLENILNELKLNFKNFYDAIFLKKFNVSGKELRTFLEKLFVNTGDFSNAMTYGEGDPLEIFKKGNFTVPNVQNALKEIGKTEEDLFDVCKEEILDTVILKNISDIINVLEKYQFGKNKALQLWNYLKINNEDVNNVAVFSNILDDLRYSLNDTIYLGVFTNDYVAINRIVLKNITEKMIPSKLFAQKLTVNATTALLNTAKSYNQQIATFEVIDKNFTTPAEIATTITDLYNCTFVTVKNDNISIQTVENVLNKNSHLEVSLDVLNVTEIVSGSPLICNNKVYGLAKYIEEEKVVFDTFVIEKSSAASFTFGTILCLICNFIYVIA